MNCADWYTMLEFCLWDGGRLPTETEWEFAAIGPTADGRPYPRDWPWGSAPPTTAGCASTTAEGGANLSIYNCRPSSEQSLLPSRRTTRVGIYQPSGGFYDLLGNVAEWTADVLGFNYLGPGVTAPATRPACALDDAYLAPVGVDPQFLCLVENYASSQVRGGSYNTEVETVLSPMPPRPRRDSIRNRPEQDRPLAMPLGFGANYGARCARGPSTTCGGATQACCTTAGQPVCRGNLVCRAAGNSSQCLDVPPQAPTRSSCAPGAAPAGCGEAPVRMPGGTFTMGGDPMVLSSVNATTGGSSVTVSPFLVDSAQVTVGRFRRFWREAPQVLNAPAPPTRAVVLPNGSRVTPPRLNYLPAPTARTSTNDCNWSLTPGTGASDRESHPLNCVSWDVAMAFCMWESPNGRLPTEAEWEFMARGNSLGGLTPGRDYPWGNTDRGTGQCNITNGAGYWYSCSPAGGPMGSGTTPWNTFPALGGLRDLNGNVAEWVMDLPSLSYGVTGRDPIDRPSWGPANMYRGASWFQPTSELERRSVTRPAGIAQGIGNVGNNYLGFRCVH